MTKTPTVMQHLVNLVATSKLNAAYATKDPEIIAKQEKCYKNLSETEVTFTKPFSSVLTGGKWQTTMTCKSRGFQINKLTYNTGTLKALTAAVIQGIAQKSSLDLVTVPGVYFVDGSENIHLVVEKDSNIFDALKLTGFEFPTESFKTTVYDARNDDLKADGHVDIDHSVVAGRFLLSYIQRAPATGTQTPAPKVAVESVTEGKDETNTETKSTGTGSVASSYDATAALTAKASTGEEEITEENTAPEQPAPTTTSSKKK